MCAHAQSVGRVLYDICPMEMEAVRDVARDLEIPIVYQEHPESGQPKDVPSSIVCIE